MRLLLGGPGRSRGQWPSLCSRVPTESQWRDASRRGSPSPGERVGPRGGTPVSHHSSLSRGGWYVCSLPQVLSPDPSQMLDSTTVMERAEADERLRGKVQLFAEKVGVPGQAPGSMRCGLFGAGEGQGQAPGLRHI